MEGNKRFTDAGRSKDIVVTELADLEVTAANSRS